MLYNLYFPGNDQFDASLLYTGHNDTALLAPPYLLVNSFLIKKSLYNVYSLLKLNKSKYKNNTQGSKNLSQVKVKVCEI